MLDEAIAEIDLVRKTLHEDELLKIGQAAKTFQSRMEKYRQVITLVGEITSANYDVQKGCDAYYQEFEKLLHNNYHELALEDDYPAEADAYAKLQGVLRRMGEIRLAPRLATRNICAVAGGFSSGKSSFLNSLIGGDDDLLPTRITPTTSIPTYIFHIEGAEQSINVFNHNGGKVEIDADMFQEMTHDFKVQYGVQLKRLVERVAIYTPKLADWNNVALVDTPGYTNPDEAEGTDSDEQVAMRSVWKSQFLVWVVDCERGTLPDQDVQLILEFLQEKAATDDGELIYIVVNKADKKTEGQLGDILEQVAETTRRHEIPCFGIALYSAHDGKWYGHEGEDFDAFLSKVAKADAVNMDALTEDVEQVFDQYVEYHNEEERRLENALGLMKRLSLGLDTQQSESLPAPKRRRSRPSQRGGKKTTKRTPATKKTAEKSLTTLEDSLTEHVRAIGQELEMNKQWSETAVGLKTRLLKSVDGFVEEIALLRNVR